jgi:2-polyprenyl-3-methyl-5-hydroxy-6-metoxy-1,4-benzoquinol methylase
MPFQLFSSLRALINLPARVEAQLGRLREELDQRVGEVQRTLKSHDLRRKLESYKEHADRLSEKQLAEHAALQREVAATRKELQDRLRHYQLQLGRVNALLENGSGARNGGGDPIPLDVPASDGQRARAPAIAWEWLKLDRCAGCGVADRTIVCEWNKSIVLERDIFEGGPRYNYALCHGCGIVYATCRPVGASYKALMNDFPETIGRGTGANATSALLNPYPLTEADRERYRKLIAGGVFVSDHDPHDHLDGVYLDRTENAAHVEILGGLLDLRGSRVLEVRSRAGTILSGLQRQFGASVAAMPIFEGQRFIMQELYGIECSDLIDYDMFTITFKGQFDLIACNHMLTHIVRLDRFFEQIRQHIKPGGHLYLYSELNEDDFLRGGKSVINTLNALHLQVFDRASLIRLLEANGFEVVFIKLRNSSHICLAKYTGDRAWTAMSSEERDRRLSAYALARTRAILRAPKPLRNRFAAVWDAALADGVAAGIVRFDEKGRPRLIQAD